MRVPEPFDLALTVRSHGWYDLAPFRERAAALERERAAGRKDLPDLRWALARGAGRLLRSPTVFEDAVKTLCTTNCSWALTRLMVERLCARDAGAAPAAAGDPWVRPLRGGAPPAAPRPARPPRPRLVDAGEARAP